MSGTGLVRAAFHCYPVLTVVIGCIPFFLKWEEMVVEGVVVKSPLILGQGCEEPGWLVTKRSRV